MADRTRLNREIAGQHGTGGTQSKAPGRETKAETQEPHAVEAEQQPTEQQPAEQQPAEHQPVEPGRRRSVFDAPLQADLDAQAAQANEADADDE